MRYHLSIILTLVSTCFANSQSLFDKEGIVKIATSEEGVHKIDYEFIESIGLNPKDINPNRIQVYGMPGGHVPQSNAIEYPYEPQPLPIKIKANSNNDFDTDELVLFYADAVQNIKYDLDLEKYTYSNNLYSDQLYFFIDFDAPKVTKIKEETSSGAPAGQIIDWYDAIYFHELESINLLSSGREWFGESFKANKTQVISFELSNELTQAKLIDLHTRYIGQTLNAAKLNISLNKLDLASVDIPTISKTPYSQTGQIVFNQSSVISSLLSGTELNVEISHEALGSDRSEGYLDYIFLSVPQKLTISEKQLVIRNKAFQKPGIFQLELEGFQSNHSVWDVSYLTNYHKVSIQNQTFNFNHQDGLPEKKFVVFNDESAYTPSFVETLSSKRLKSGNAADYLIVAYDDFMPVAEKLANFRRTYNGYSVEVASISAIANEFGSGRKDVSAIRNYIRYFYQLNPEKLKYVLMLGGASYDYKDRVKNNTNLVPVYQSRNSLHPVFTYASDDFYGFMDENEGLWEEESSNTDDVDLGIGRIPAKTLEEASDAITKIIHYETNEQSFNKWRNDLYFIADDEDGNLFHRDSERLSEYVTEFFGRYNIKKLYLGAYAQDALASSQKSPKMQNAINEMVDGGALIVNYIGHGAEQSWASESILNMEMVNEWKNLNHLPLFVTATCEYGRFDDPLVISGAQQMLLKADGGAIALLTTSRPVESNSNATLNRAFFENVFKREGESPKKLGDIIKGTKNAGIVGVKNRNFILLGDPALTLAEPKNKIKIEEIVNENGRIDTLEGMSKVTVVGAVENNEGQRLINFDGELTAEFFDKPKQSSTIDPSEDTFNFLAYDQTLFRGKASVSDGAFEFSFFVPKEINYAIGKGKFSLYAKQKDELVDAGGFDNSFSIGGTSNIMYQDKIGPDIDIFLNSRSFMNGDKTGSDVELIVDFFDEHGISISNSEINAGITMSLDGEEEIKLNDFFFYNIDSYQKGSLTYTISDLAEGQHYLTISARDAFNNKSKASIDFEVVGDDKLSILDFVMYPNPANEQVSFGIRRNIRNQQVELSYHILNNYGQLIYSHSYLSENDYEEDVWNLKDENGRKLLEGIYFVKVFLRSIKDNAKTEQIKKLIVIN